MAGKARRGWGGDTPRIKDIAAGDERTLLHRRLGWGENPKAVYVRGRELQVLGVQTAAARRIAMRGDWSLAGVYSQSPDLDQVLADIAVTRQEQRESRDVMRNQYVRA